MWSTVGFFLAALALVAADTPANCTYGEIAGTWIFKETARTSDKEINCHTNIDPPKNTIKINLEHFDTAVDEYGNEGTWTIIYNQGFEITVNERVYFVFSKYEEDEKTVTSFCGETMEGWSHDVLGNNWACFSGEKEESVEPKTYNKDGSDPIVNPVFTSTDEYVNTLNSVQKSWRAKKYERFEGMTREQLNNMAGGVKSRLLSFPQPDPTKKPKQSGLRGDSPLPEAFDWRDVNGVNYVPDVRDQENCGSCYIFASMGMLESRIRILTDNNKQPLLSPQHVLSCSKYSQGCSGGFPYLIAGKFAQDYGLIEEEYMPYEAVETECVATESPRHYVSEYDYVGGYYGACNEEAMMRSLVEEGPVAVGFQVWDDFRQYESGVYHHTGVQNTAVQGSFNPFYEVNHAVLVVGYGVEEETGEKYWIVMNSWGAEWGDHGYFKILRGVNECGIESLAVRATPIP